jgi:phage gp36-like protein
MGIWIDQDTLVAAIGPTDVVALFDDDNDGMADAAAIELVIGDAEAEVQSYLVGDYPNPLPVSASSDNLLRRSAIDFAVCYAYERRPEYPRTKSEATKRQTRFERATARMQRIQSAIQIPPTLSQAAQPANIGGIVTDNSKRIIIDGADGTFNGGDF